MIEKMDEAMRAAEASWDQHLGKWLAAGAYLNARRVAEGRAAVDQAIAGVAAGGAGLFEADLHQLKGEFSLMSGGEALSEAEDAFNSAIAIARRQHAKSFELRATLSICATAHEARPPRRSSHAARRHLQLVHRRLRHCRLERRQSPAR